MREIEIKVRVTDTAATLAALQKAGISLSEPKKQHDVVYGLPGAVENHPDYCWLRLRTENDTTTTLTLKRNVTEGLDSIEHETVIEDADAMAAIIDQLGYKLYSDLTKIRRKGHAGDIEICFDEVPELGTFLEAEKLCADDADRVAVEAELWQYVGQFGLDKANQETVGYDVLLERLKRS